MAGYSLASDERMIIKSDYVYKDEGGIFDHVGNYELMLTNKAIVLSKKGFSGKVKEFEVFPTRMIKVIDGQVQAHMSTVNTYVPTLDVYFVNSQASFVFQKKSEVVKWVDAINQLLTGRSSYVADTTNAAMAIPGAEAIAATVAGTVDVFKNAFGRSKKERARMVSTRCPSCSGSVQGRQGETVACPYCGVYIMLN